MRFQRILGLFSAAMVLGAAVVMPVYADEETEIPEFSADYKYLTLDTEAPTLSFDKDVKSFVKATPDGEKINISVSQEKTYAYQGATLTISAEQPQDISDFCTYSTLIRDSNGNLVYPGSDVEDAPYLTMGVELDAADFGLTCFDGCMFSFKYRINQDAEGKLVGDSVFAFPCTEEYKRVTSTGVQLKINTNESDNVTQYANAIVSVPEKCGATKFVFEVPVIKQMAKTDVLYVDNIVISTPLEESGGDLQVKNMDGYNENAKAQEIVQGLKVQPKSNGLDSSSTADKAESGGVSPVMIIVIVVVVIVVAGVVFFVIRKAKNRFY